MAVLQAISQTSPDRIVTEKSTARCATDSPHDVNECRCGLCGQFFISSNAEFGE